MAVEAVIFDWGGTLTPFHDIDWREPWRAFVAALDGVASPGLADLLFTATDEWHLRARETLAAFTIDEVMRDVGAMPTEAALRAFYDWWVPHTYTDPEAEPLLRALRERGIRTGVLSNTMWPREIHDGYFLRDGVFDLFDATVYTSELAWTKPHPETFHTAMTAVGATDPAACVFVGDQLHADIWGAHEFGMRTAFVPHSTGFPPANITPDTTLPHLAALLPFIDTLP
jgi:putative hydrolase of the HAD superfamily